MTPVGETLRRERMKRNLDIEEISRELKISRGSFRRSKATNSRSYPAEYFAKSFVRQYARLLGLDEDQISGQVQQNLAPVPETSQLPEKEKPARFTAISVPKVDEWQTVGDRRFHWSGWLSALGLVAVMLVCSAVYTWMQRPRSAVLSHDPTVQNAAAQTAPAPVQTPSPVAAAQTPAEQPSAQATSQPVNTAAAPPSPAASQTKPPETRTNQPNSTDAKPVAAGVARAARRQGIAGRHGSGQGHDHRRRGGMGTGARRQQVRVFGDHGPQHDPHGRREQGRHASPGQRRRRHDLVEWQAYRTGRPQRPGTNDSVHFWRFPDRARGQATLGRTARASLRNCAR